MAAARCAALTTLLLAASLPPAGAHALAAGSADERGARALRRRAGLVRYARELAAGGVAEAAMDGVLFPIDTLKARRQAFQRHRMPSARRTTVRELMALGNPLRGIGFAFLSALPAGASFVGAKWGVEKAAHAAMRTTGHGAAVTMLASACADVMYWLVRFPAETGKLRVQALQDRSTLGAVRRLLAEGGWRPGVLYSGWQTVLWRDVPYDALEVKRGRHAPPRSARARPHPAPAVPSLPLCLPLLSLAFTRSAARSWPGCAGRASSARTGRATTGGSSPRSAAAPPPSARPC